MSAADIRHPLLTSSTAPATVSRARYACLQCCCIFCCFVATLSTILLVILAVIYLKQHPSPQNCNQRILLWQWHNPKLEQYVGCEFIDGSQLSPEQLRNHTNFDAVIFNATADFKAHPLPIPRLPQQYYIYALDKPLTPAFQALHNVSELAEFFNLTFSYKLDSNLLWLPYTVSNFNTTYAPHRYAHWPPLSENISNFRKNAYLSKYNTTQLLGLAVMDAPCNQTQNKLLQGIANLLQVDIYGDCGSMRLSQPDKLPIFGKTAAYKFYFAFETELCTDYVSPYFYQALIAGIVPVVFGGADYRRFAPPHSYIDASDFKTIHGLFDYLQYLQQNVEEYIKYIAWREQYQIKRTQIEFDNVCELVKSGYGMRGRRRSRMFDLWWHNNKCYEAKPDTFILNEVKISH